MADATYRDFVMSVANGTDTPSEVILNRSPAHAAIIVEALFLQARSHVKILTEQLLVTAYGCEGVCTAARDFLARDPAARIDVLAETNVVRADHPFFRCLDDAGHRDQATLRFVPPALRAQYQFNFAIADDRHLRFENSRESAEAAVVFRDTAAGQRLARIFDDLAVQAVDAL